MKRLHKTAFIVAVLLFAALAIPTSALAVDYDTELRVYYYENGLLVGQARYSSCVGSNWFWGQQSGTQKLEKTVKCSDGSAIDCNWYRWTGSAWQFHSGPDCPAGGGIDDPPDDKVDGGMDVLASRRREAVC